MIRCILRLILGLWRLQVESLEDPVAPVSAVVARCNKQQVFIYTSSVFSLQQTVNCSIGR